MEAKGCWIVALGKRESIGKKRHVITDSAGRAYEFIIKEGCISTPQSLQKNQVGGRGRMISRGMVNIATKFARTYTSEYEQKTSSKDTQVLLNWEYKLELCFSSEGDVIAECMGKWSGVFSETDRKRTGGPTDGVENSLEMNFPQMEENDNLWSDGKKKITLKISYKLNVKESVQKITTSTAEEKCPLLRHLINKRNSDVIIKCGEDQFDVHKLVLSCYSPVFTRMLISPMEESTTNIVRIEDFDVETVRDMISFMYEGTVRSNSATSLVALLDCAEKYEILELKALVLQKMIDSMSPWNAAEFAAASTKYGADANIKEKLFDYCKSNFQNLRTNKEFKKFFKENVDLFL